jgi:hypothetical protein
MNKKKDGKLKGGIEGIRAKIKACEIFESTR